MNRKTILASLALCAVSASAQITIGGHQPFYDEATQSMLFATSQASLSNLTANLDTIVGNKWANITIDNKPIIGKTAFCFGDVSEDRTFILSAMENDSSIVRTIRFTSLPILHIVKEDAFTNDYGKATLAFDSADTLMTGNCKIKHRGGSTNMEGRHKRNYKFKLADENWNNLDRSLLGMREDKSWILDAGQVDMFRLRNNICHNLWLDFSAKPYYHDEEPKMTNGCHAKAVELFVNNEYRGVYSLMEPVDRKQLKLKKYKDGVKGLLYKTGSWVGTTFYNTISQPYDNHEATWGGWEVKYPEPGDDADTTDYKPLGDFISLIAFASDADVREEIENKLDVAVYIDYVLFVQLINGMDNRGKNMYWSIYNSSKEKHGKLVPTPWDMDATFGQFYAAINDPKDSLSVLPTIDLSPVTNIDKRLRNALGNDYSNMVESRYAALRRNYFGCDSLSQRFTNAHELLRSNGATHRESAKWSGDSDIGGNVLDFEKELSYIKDWIAKRLDFLDNKYNYAEASGINSIDIRRNSDANAVYNIQGQKVSSSYRGIVIVNGKKRCRR